MIRRRLAAALALAVVACGAAPAGAALFGGYDYRLVPAFPALKFREPLDLQMPPDGSGRFFVVEKDGRILAFPGAGAASAELFLDLSSVVYARGEGGLLGLAFHPKFRRNGYFYVYYTIAGPRRVRVSRFSTGAESGKADADSEKVILEVPYPDNFTNHNAGSIVFGPVDGMLYLGMGDGGGAGDPSGNGQNLKVLLGKILRIDVDHADDGLAYAIPDDNPFAQRGGVLPEIYAYGLRNPWRMSFDVPAAGDQRLWVADVGQNQWEEIDLVEPGGNYGWNIMEGTHCFKPPQMCDVHGLANPVAEYGHGEGRSVIGGLVYRGTSFPELAGRYLFTDFISGRVWALNADVVRGKRARMTPIAHLMGRWPGIGHMGLVSFGRDQAGEVYIVDHIGGVILRLAPSE